MTELSYPSWVYQELIDNSLPWQEGQRMSFSQFHEQYTLHDSYWIGIFHNVAFEQVVKLAIVWDDVWLPKVIKKNTTIIDNLFYLFIKLTGVEQVSTANYIDIGCVCRAIASSEILELEGKKFLAIDDVYGGQINIVYQGQEIFLAIGQNKNIFKI